MGNNRAEQARMRNELEKLFPNLHYDITKDDWVRISGPRDFYGWMCLRHDGSRWSCNAGGGTFERVRDNMVAYIRKHFGW